MKATNMSLIDEMAKALRIANNAIYFDDNSDYQTALYQVCASLGMLEDDIGSEYIEEGQALTLLDGKVLVEKAQYLMMRQQMRYLGMVLLQNGEATITEKTQREFSDKAIRLENIMTVSGGMSIRLTYLQRRKEENENDRSDGGSA